MWRGQTGVFWCMRYSLFFPLEIVLVNSQGHSEREWGLFTCLAGLQLCVSPQWRATQRRRPGKPFAQHHPCPYATPSSHMIHIPAPIRSSLFSLFICFPSSPPTFYAAFLIFFFFFWPYKHHKHKISYNVGILFLHWLLFIDIRYILLLERSLMLFTLRQNCIWQLLILQVIPLKKKRARSVTFIMGTLQLLQTVNISNRFVRA